MRNPTEFTIQEIQDGYKELNKIFRDNECNDELIKILNEKLNPVERNLLINFILCNYNYSVLAKTYGCSHNTMRKYIKKIQDKVKCYI